MKRIIMPALILLLGGITITAFTFNKETTPKPVETVTWYTWQEAVELNKKQPKKLLVDVYTSWCGWCKVMDKETFTDPKIAEYLNKNYYCIKLDAEMKETIEFGGQKFEHIAGVGRGGVHNFAYSLLDGQMSYPTIVYLTEKFERVVISPGYKKPNQLMPELKFTAEEAFKTKTFEAYMGEAK
jgi:thioredoxin-related protein